MKKNNEKKKRQLGMAQGTASNRLKKSIMFALVVETGKDICFQCLKQITHEHELSIEHKVPWLDSEDPKDLFFDLNNIAFSHLRCNISASRKYPRTHGIASTYNVGCRCEKCTEAHRVYTKKKRNKNKLR